MRKLSKYELMQRHRERIEAILQEFGDDRDAAADAIAKYVAARVGAAISIERRKAKKRELALWAEQGGRNHESTEEQRHRKE